jgi:hypothetical protein
LEYRLEDGVTRSSISPSVYIAFTSLQAANACGWIGKTSPESTFDETNPYTTMAFDPSEISTIHYLDFELSDRPRCPEGYVAKSKTMTRQMTWSDLTEDCETVQPGISYHEDFNQNWIFSESQYMPIHLPDPRPNHASRQVPPLVSFSSVLLSFSSKLQVMEDTTPRRILERTPLSLSSIAIPSRVIEMHPEWASCSPVCNSHAQIISEHSTKCMDVYLGYTWWLVGPTNNATWR